MGRQLPVALAVLPARAGGCSWCACGWRCCCWWCCGWCCWSAPPVGSDGARRRAGRHHRRPARAARPRRPGLWWQQALPAVRRAPAAMPPSTAPGRHRSTPRRCSTPRRPRCWATSTTPASATAASRRCFRPGMASSMPAPTAPTAGWPISRSSTPSVWRRCNSTWWRCPVAGFRPCPSPGTAGLRPPAASAGFANTPTRRSTSRTGCTGQNARRTGTSCAPTATRRW